MEKNVKGQREQAQRLSEVGASDTLKLRQGRQCVKAGEAEGRIKRDTNGEKLYKSTSVIFFFFFSV